MLSRAFRAIRVGIGLLILVASATWIGIALRFAGVSYEGMPCFRESEELIQEFSPHCVATSRGGGGPVLYHINEDGLRDRARSELLATPRRVLVVGDSFVEGVGVPAEESLAGALGKQLPQFRFLNVGLRSWGTFQESKRIEQLLPTYAPVGVLWMLEDNDLEDDQLACGAATRFDSFGRPARYSLDVVRENPLEHAIFDFTAGWGATSAVLRRYEYQRRWFKIASSPGATRCDPCAGIRAGAALLREKKIRVMAVLNPPLRVVPQYPYRRDLGSRERLSACFTAEKIPVIDSSKFADTSDALYWPGDAHYNGKGIARFAEAFAPKVGAWLR